MSRRSYLHYEISPIPKSVNLPRETAATLDHAMHRAAKLSERGAIWTVTRVEEDASRTVRAVAEYGKAHYAETCRGCGGTGLGAWSDCLACMGIGAAPVRT